LNKQPQALRGFLFARTSPYVSAPSLCEDLYGTGAKLSRLQDSRVLLIPKRRSMQMGSTMPILHLYIASREKLNHGDRAFMQQPKLDSRRYPFLYSPFFVDLVS
jgi:hypothetical protein